ncbi:synemin [Tachysurus ichikawai]
MFQFKKSFEGEKLQLQELNQRLMQYLSRAKLLEQENARLLAEINTIRHHRSTEWEETRMEELREMRRLVEQLSLEKSRAEMEREKMRIELQLLQAMRSDETALSKGLDGELKGFEKQLRHALQTNCALEERLIQLQNECALLHDAHRNEVAHLRNQVHTRVLPVTRTYSGPSAFTTEEIQDYALSLSESWMETFEMYRQEVEKMEESIKADQARLEDIRREKVGYALELNKLQVQMEKHSQIQLELEEHLMGMQEKFRKDVRQYQIIVEELEQERILLANNISEKLKDHHDLLQVKMGLGMEVAAYRALLEGEGKHAQMRSDQYSRERIIDIKLPVHPYTPRRSTMAASQPEVRRNLIGYDVWKMEPISSMRTSTVSSQFDSHKTSRILPITVSNHAQQSPAARRDMISFTKAKQASSTPSATKPVVSANKIGKKVMEEQTVIIKGVSKSPPRSSPDIFQSEIQNKLFPTTSSTVEIKSVKVVAPQMMSLNTDAEPAQIVVDKNYKRKDERTEGDHAKATVQPDATPFIQQKAFNQEAEKSLKDSGNVQSKVFAGEEKVLDSVSMEEIIEKVIKPAGFDTKISSSADSKITYHVEKTEQEDGSTKTQIVLQSKVEEDLDVSDNSALEELLSKGIHKVSLEDIEGTPTGNMIHNLLRLGLENESLENKSVKVEIMETPLESPSDEGRAETEDIVEVKFKPYSQTSSMFFHIEEPENEPQPAKQHENTDESVKASEYSKSGFVQVLEMSRDESLPYYSQGQETQEYFVSTPEDNMSESEESGGFMSYGHYGAVEDLSDERYYQEEGLPTSRMYFHEGEKNRESPEYIKRDVTGIPECIIEEEVHVSPQVQESMLEILKEESLDPREQLKGALEQLEGTVSGALKEELVSFTKAGQSSENLSVNFQKVQQSPDNGKMTFVAELNISQCLEDSGLLQDEVDDLSLEQVMAAQQSSSSDLHQAHSSGAGGEYTIRLSSEEVQKEKMPWMASLEETEGLCSASEKNKTEKVIRLGPNERSFTFQMDINNSASKTDPSLKVCQEKRIATVYLDSFQED